MATGNEKKGQGILVVRIGLVVYLVLAIAAGPALCCCTTRGLFDFFSPGYLASVAGGADQSSYHACCHRHGKNTRRPGEKRNHGPQRHRDCPCQDSRPDVAYLSPAKSVLTENPAQFLIIPGPEGMIGFLPRSSSPAHEALTQRPRECIAFPFHDPKEILFALQTLRC